MKLNCRANIFKDPVCSIHKIIGQQSVVSHFDAFVNVTVAGGYAAVDEYWNYTKVAVWISNI